MSISRQEEIIAVLWILAAILAFGFNYPTWGWIFTVKAISDTIIAIYFGIMEAKHE